jgi:hypothetical protein
LGAPTFKNRPLPTVPPLERVAALRRDYLAMRDMYRVEPMDFERILKRWARLKGG